MSKQAHPQHPPRGAARVLVDNLIALGADTAFCVPGESYLQVLDALHDESERLRLITCRQEGGAAFMADAYGKLTGKPGICLVTRGPGATNAAIGVHTARQDSTPMLLFIGQVGRPELGREAFQEVDYRQMFAPLAKWATQIDDAARIPEILARAWHVAVSGRPGPVVIALPEDMLSDTVAVPDVMPTVMLLSHPAPEAYLRLGELLAEAARPMLVVGGSAWTAAARASLTAFAARWHLPVAAAFRRQDVFDNEHPCYVGELGTSASPALARRLVEADLVIALGARLDEMTTNGYTLIEAPLPRQRLVHIHPEAEELHHVYRPTLGVSATVQGFCAGLECLLPGTSPAWQAWTDAARGDYEANRSPGHYPGALDMGEVMRTLAAQLPDDVIVCNGAGNFTGWPQRFHRFRHYPSQLAPTSGAMGYGLPAGVAASLVCPQRQTLVFAGDGDFLMNGQELATAIQHGGKPLVLVVNNGMYGTIRMHQERRYPERVVATALYNPDFAALARAFGAHGEQVHQTAEFAPALARALASGTAALIELIVDPEQITTRGTLSGLRAGA
ncbi:MAG: thiamine pyrophosphate-binding protein [Rhodocyclaceae bacterium]